VGSDSSELQEGYRHYLRYFETKEEPNYVQYNIQEFSKLSDGVHFKSEKYAVAYDEQGITEYTTYANHATNFWIQILLVKNNLSFIHAAAVEINGKGFIFPAPGGIGKTALISYLRNLPGFKFFGDDFVIVNSQGEMFSYPSDFSIYPYHLTVFPEIKNMKAGKFLRSRKYFFGYYWVKKAINFIAKRTHFSSGPLLKGWNSNYAKVPAEALISTKDIGVKTAIYATVFLERYTGDTIEVETVSSEELVKMVVNVLNTEFKYGISYFNILTASLGLNPNDFYEKQRDILKAAISNTKCYRFKIPEKFNTQTYFNHINNFIKSI